MLTGMQLLRTGVTAILLRVNMLRSWYAGTCQGPRQTRGSIELRMSLHPKDNPCYPNIHLQYFEVVRLPSLLCFCCSK